MNNEKDEIVVIQNGRYVHLSAKLGPGGLCKHKLLLPDPSKRDPR